MITPEEIKKEKEEQKERMERARREEREKTVSEQVDTTERWLNIEMKGIDPNEWTTFYLREELCEESIKRIIKKLEKAGWEVHYKYLWFKSNGHRIRIKEDKTRNLLVPG